MMSAVNCMMRVQSRNQHSFLRSAQHKAKSHEDDCVSAQQSNGFRLLANVGFRDRGYEGVFHANPPICIAQLTILDQNQYTSVLVSDVVPQLLPNSMSTSATQLSRLSCSRWLHYTYTLATSLTHPGPRTLLNELSGCPSKNLLRALTQVAGRCVKPITQNGRDKPFGSSAVEFARRRQQDQEAPQTHTRSISHPLSLPPTTAFAPAITKSPHLEKYPSQLGHCAKISHAQQRAVIKGG